MSEKGKGMTREERLRVLAELDGVYFGNTPYDSEEIWRTFEGEPCALKPYLTSYDAIIPLIQKQSRDTKEETGSRIVETLTESDTNIMDGTPEQLADALIKAVGKWRQ